MMNGLKLALPRNLLPLFIFAMVGISGCQWCTCSDESGMVVRTRVVDPSGKILENVTAGYCPPKQNTFKNFTLRHNQYGHWGTIPGDLFSRGTVRFSCPGYHDETWPRETIPEEIRLRPKTR